MESEVLRNPALRLYLTVGQHAKMTTFQSILTLLMIGFLGSFQNCSTVRNELQNSDASKILTKLQGTWTHSEDSLATVKISENNWTFIYDGESTLTDSFEIQIIDSLPEHVDPKVNSEFLILKNQKDTMEYEIFGLTDTTISLMYFPRGNMHLYKRMKNKKARLPNNK
jgi:hypothetical protein